MGPGRPGSVGPVHPTLDGISLLPIRGIPEVRPGDVLAEQICAAAAADGGPGLRHHDVVVVTQKVVSKAEGRLVPVDPDAPDDHKRLVLDEAVRVVRRRRTPRGELLVTQTRHGFVCANSGVDLSNVEHGWAPSSRSTPTARRAASGTASAAARASRSA